MMKKNYHTEYLLRSFFAVVPFAFQHAHTTYAPLNTLILHEK